MIVVSNTSPLTNLAAIGQFDLLHQLFGELYLPLGVINELSFAGTKTKYPVRFWQQRRKPNKSVGLLRLIKIFNLMLFTEKPD